MDTSSLAFEACDTIWTILSTKLFQHFKFAQNTIIIGQYSIKHSYFNCNSIYKFSSWKARPNYFVKRLITVLGFPMQAFFEQVRFTRVYLNRLDGCHYFWKDGVVMVVHEPLSCYTCTTAQHRLALSRVVDQHLSMSCESVWPNKQSSFHLKCYNAL